jgi:hypothetical protein
MFQISTATEFYGDVTEEAAAAYAELLADAVKNEFGIEAEAVFTNNTNNREADPDGEIQQWLNDNWTDICQ